MVESNSQDPCYEPEAPASILKPLGEVCAWAESKLQDGTQPPWVRSAVTQLAESARAVMGGLTGAITTAD